MRKVILTTGGTGGHIFPALAVAEKLREVYPDVELLFIGGEYGPEATLAEQADIPFLGLPVRGFLGRGFKAFSAGLGLLRGFFKASRKIRLFKPDIIIGFGGYAAVASILAGYFCRIPILIHEQNSVPGFANRLLGRMADEICISLPDSARWFKNKNIVLTGNPIRSGIRELYTRKSAGDTTTGHKIYRNVLVLGGSQGARAVNTAMLQELPFLYSAGVNVHIQCGKADYERVAAAAAHYPDHRVRVEEFITDINEAYDWADLVVCRAGATTVAELAVAGMPSVLIPFPAATHNHQYYNALQLEKSGAAILIEQKNITPGKLSENILTLLKDKKMLERMSLAALKLALPDAADTVVAEAASLLQSSNIPVKEQKRAENS